MDLTVARYDSPIGPLGLAVDAAGAVRRVRFDADEAAGEAPAAVVEALDAYFGGDRDALARIAWTVEGDGFRERVWRALAQIPAGTVISYGEMARRAGEPGAAKAAGAALNRNPIPLVLPCHRVTGHDGSLVGFGGGVERKRWLLAHEGALLL